MLCSALYSPGRSCVARVWDLAGRDLTLDLLRARITQAQRHRQQLFSDQPRDAYRVVHGEADLLPGLIIDRYAHAAVVQTGTLAFQHRKHWLGPLLAQCLDVSLVVCRDDGSARDLESLPREKGILYQAQAPSRSTLVRFHDAQSLMEADLLDDRKTGSFLDQQENHALCGSYAARFFSGQAATALDAFTYHGGFALALARAGLSVTACDEDAQAIGRTQHNARLNGVSLDLRRANAFDFLRERESQGARFDVVVIDPPALAKRGRSAAAAPAASDDAALRAYKELNLRAMRLLAPHGLLVTASCSGRVTPQQFGGVLEAAAADAGRALQLIERRGAGRDHPLLVGFSGSEYLKCWFFRALR